MTSMNEICAAINAHSLIEQAQVMIGSVEKAYRRGQAVHEVEQELFKQALELGRLGLGLFFKLCGDGDRGERVKLSDGREVKRLETLHGRAYHSVFGLYELERVVYGTREGQKIEYVPLDEQLQLPQSKFSYRLQDWNQTLAVQLPYASVNAALEKLLDFSQSVHSLERGNEPLSASVGEFWQARLPGPEAQGKEIVVATVDGKGVVMRQAKPEPEEVKTGECENPREEDASADDQPKGRKKMAVIGSAYTIAPYVRTPEEVLEALFRTPKVAGEEAAEPRPKPLAKAIRASLRRDEDETLKPAYEEIFGWLGEEVRHRSAEGHSATVLLMDGQKSLWTAGKARLGKVSPIEILDLLHANSSVWKAAALLYPQAKAEELIFFVKPRIKRLLNGEVESVIRGLRAMGTRRGLKGERLKKLTQLCAYLQNNAHRMRYDEYLAAGYPIASGVIEGACRHVIKDRMERSGMRWTLSGAQSMLTLRCIYLNGDWEAYMKFHITKETCRLYPYRAANDDDNGLAQVA